MYRLYTQQAINTNVKIASEHLYRQEFKQFNVSCQTLKQDCCVKCFNFNSVSPTEISEELKEEFQEYIAKKNSARQDKANDMVKAVADKSVYCVAFDLQKVLDTLSAEAGPLEYERKLSVYNLDSGTKACKAFISNETEGHRGANEIQLHVKLS